MVTRERACVARQRVTPKVRNVGIQLSLLVTKRWRFGWRGEEMARLKGLTESTEGADGVTGHVQEALGQRLTSREPEDGPKTGRGVKLQGHLAIRESARSDRKRL